MARNGVQFQKGLSEPAFEQQYGTEEQCRAIVVAARWPRGLELYKSALELSDSVRCNERQSAIMMVRRCMADLKPGVFDAPLRGCGA
jgi:hypothetical protein